MRAWFLASWFAVGCGGGAAVAPAPVAFTEVVGAWRLTNPEAGKTSVIMDFGERSIDFGVVEGICQPSRDLPFTEVQGQKSFAALVCNSPDGGTHHVVLVEILGPEPDWPAPAAMGMVLSRVTGEGTVALLTLGAAEVPLGLVPLPPGPDGHVPGTGAVP